MTGSFSILKKEPATIMNLVLDTQINGTYGTDGTDGTDGTKVRSLSCFQDNMSDCLYLKPLNFRDFTSKEIKNNPIFSLNYESFQLPTARRD